MTTKKSTKDEATMTATAAKDEIPDNFKDEIERARAAQSRCREAQSKITATSLRKDPRKLLIEQHVPGAIDKFETRTYQGRPTRVKVADADYSVCFTGNDKTTRHRKLSEGWEPVVYKGEQVIHGADVLWKRPNDITLTERKVFERESQARLTREAAEKSAASSGVQVEEVSSEKDTL